MPSAWWGLGLVPLAWLSLRRPLWLPLLFLLAGFFWVTLRAGWLLDDRLPVELEGKDVRIEGYVADIPQKFERGIRFPFDVEHAVYKGTSVSLPGKILLSRYDDKTSPEVGHRWRFTVRLKRPHGFQNPGGFDYESFLFRERIGATGYIRARQPSQQLPGYSILYAVDRIRQRLGERIRYLLDDNPVSGIMVALTNGDRRGITNAQWVSLRRTGTNHLIAISGLHIGLVAGFVFFLGRWLWALAGSAVLRWPAPKVAAASAMFAAVIYAALAGFSIPTQRALIMLTVAMGAVILQRRVAATQLLAIALFVVLVHDPLAVMGAGFWLSFAAVTVIILSVHGHSVGRNKWYRLGSVQWAIAIGLLPLMLVLFHQVSIVGPVANIVAVPVFSLLIVPLTLLAAILSFLPDAIARMLFALAAWPLELMWGFLEYLAGFAHSLWIQHNPGTWALAAGLIGVALLLAPRGWPARWVGVVWLSPLFLLRPPAPLAGEIWLTLLDVGQGVAAVVRTAEHTLVYDTGPRFSARFDAGAAVVVPYLFSKGISYIDTLIVSHGDNDHIGGVRSVLESVHVGRVLSSVPDRVENARECHSGQRWRWDDVEFAIVHPPGDGSFRGNNAACVLMVQSLFGSVMLPGDIEKSAETALVEGRGAQLAADVLVVPHHGSKTSSTESFLDAVRPRIALIPAGYRNRFRHPNADVKERYLRRGIRLYASPADGAIEVQLGLEGIQTSSYRERKRRYWFNP
ncbi:MAG: DNA internalization-related competence protein ComEC/Rec2 [Acidiferrobacterales bacterium]|nr:DNA internalization-related competence protein ComEC/Rec2 [Gammaproteobacteria bacterium]